ncbi:YegP family protein [Micromonospora carbonacea]|uniref:YegP family protein n=1 Tax=Micromonospora carbonacea TaxID=47853 RepID=UPI003D764E6B
MEFQIRNAQGNQGYYWRIVASNGKVLAASETYYNKGDAQSAAQSVKSNAASAPIVDYTGTASYGRW